MWGKLGQVVGRGPQLGFARFSLTLIRPRVAGGGRTTTTTTTKILTARPQKAAQKPRTLTNQMVGSFRVGRSVTFGDPTEVDSLVTENAL